jgi:hypothetical protein
MRGAMSWKTREEEATSEGARSEGFCQGEGKPYARDR